MAVFQLFQEILTLLATLGSNPYVGKVLGCVTTQSGFAAILTCILASPPPATDTAATAAHNKIVAAIQAHVAANP